MGCLFPRFFKVVDFPPGEKMVLWDVNFDCCAAICFQFCELFLNPLPAVIVSSDGMGSCDMSKLLMNPIGVRAWIFGF